MNLKEAYSKRRDYYKYLNNKQSQTLNFIGILRLIIFIGGILLSILFYRSKAYYISGAILISSIILFAVLVMKHSKFSRKKSISEMLWKINEQSILRVEGKWKSFNDKGQEFIDKEHNYSGDLDIFGDNSLFQWINTARTYIGRKKLKSILEETPLGTEDIYKRQEAIKELSHNVGWRQRLEAESLIKVETKEDPQFLFQWIKEKKELYSNPFLQIFIKLLPIVTVGLIIIYFLTHRIPYYIPTIFILIQIIILAFKFKEMNTTLEMVYRYKKSIVAFKYMLELIENKKFKSNYLNELKYKIIQEEKNKASIEVNKLAKIAQLISDRGNMYYIVIDILLLWDYQLVIALEKWKKESGILLETWLEVVGEFEALCSLAIIHHDNPDWSMPKILDTENDFKAKNMGHPLLGDKKVCNNLFIERPNKVIIITGSNMSGKSTLLRTCGINLVLAYSGAPVCAEDFQCSIMNIYTCMRISDDLEMNISSFYAELLRVKKIVEASKRNEHIFFLLDEIFKGTNSKDRHTGARILINTLSNENAIGLISTHDLELGELEEENNKVKNYHLKEYYEDSKIYFDYKLRQGVSTTRNALYLMKMAGINIENINE